MKKTILSILTFLTIGVYAQKVDTIQTKQLDEVTISAYQATALSPITYSNLTATDISLRNHGQDPSQILSFTPSVTSYSDAGNYYGYSYIRMRGIDQTRINMSLNGVPMNEPEDQGCYFSNYPDVLQSIENIQIQRGSGMSKNGVSSYAGSINLESYQPKEERILVSFGGGSFGSSRLSWQVEDSIKKLKYYVQISSTSSNGYRYHSGNESGSLFFTSIYKHKKSTYKLVAFSGVQNNELAWIGSSMDSIKKDPRHNACSTEETDRFLQNHTQFHHIIQINDKTKLNYCVYYNYLKGGYSFDWQNFVGLPTYDVYSYNFLSHFVGSFVNYTKTIKNLQLLAGVNSFYYERRHLGTEKTIGWLYTNKGFRNEISGYTKAILKIDRHFNLYGDIQYRYSDFAYKGVAVMEPFKWNFINYNTGFSYTEDKNVLYYSVGKTHREPTRNDIFMGSDDMMIDTTGNSVYNKLNPEQSIDQEIGWRYNSDKLYFNLNMFYMNFKNELTLNGQFGPTGLPLHENVDKSFRKGIEFDMKYKFNNGFYLSNSSSYNNSIIEQDILETHPVLSPECVINQEVGYKYKHFFSSINFRFQSFSYIDFGNNYRLPSYKTVNVSTGLKYDRVEFTVWLNNVTNERYYTMGGLNYDWTSPVYFVNMPFNVFASIKLIF